MFDRLVLVVLFMLYLSLYLSLYLLLCLLLYWLLYMRRCSFLIVVFHTQLQRPLDARIFSAESLRFNTPVRLASSAAQQQAFFLINP